jgi:hypothetical protein
MINISKIDSKIGNELHIPLNIKVYNKMDSFLMQNTMGRVYNNMLVEISHQFHSLIKNNLKK